MKTLLVLLTVAVAFAAKRFDGEQVLRIVPEQETHLKELARLERAEERLDFWKGPTRLTRPVDVRVPKDLLKDIKTMLDKMGMQYTVMVQDVQQSINAERSRVRAAGFGFDQYNSYNDILAQLQTFATSYPSLASVVDIGTSYEGRPMKAIKIGSARERSNKPAIFLEGQIHAREWVVSATLLYNIKFLLESYNSVSEITTLLNRVDFYFLPITNPDGYEFSRNSDRMWRKTRILYGSSWWGGYCYGADPNRNWDAGFGGPGTSTDPCSDTYHGPSAFSEPETLALKNWLQANGNNIKAYLAVHAYSQMWMTPYGYTNSKPAHYNEQNRLAAEVVDAIQSVNGLSFEHGTIADVIYLAAGSSCDWTYDALGIKYSYAIELRDTGNYGFLLPENQILPSANEFYAGLLVVARQVDSEYN